MIQKFIKKKKNKQIRFKKMNHKLIKNNNNK